MAEKIPTGPEKPRPAAFSSLTKEEGPSQSTYNATEESFRCIICPVLSSEAAARALTGKLQHHVYFNGGGE